MDGQGIQMSGPGFKDLDNFSVKSSCSKAHVKFTWVMENYNALIAYEMHTYQKEVSKLSCSLENSRTQEGTQ